MPKKIIIVRHGETQYNVERRLQGWTDIPLNENGHKQAERVAERLSQETISIIYSSDHKRAYKTASYIGKKHSLKPLKRRALREDRMGIFEGWQWEKEPDSNREKLWEQRMHAHATGDMEWKTGDGESLKEHTERVQKQLKKIESRHSTETVVIVTHGGTINRIMEIYGFKKITDEYIGYKNTSVTILIKTKAKDGYELEVHNDISHL